MQFVLTAEYDKTYPRESHGQSDGHIARDVLIFKEHYCQ